uniref:hypothetical protein n=1 Tax=Enterocloster clostridioformis TaxID=1531 RepID=UPI002675D014|nr:hypothetical protein [Enterocloster clostridioformis]
MTVLDDEGTLAGLPKTGDHLSRLKLTSLASAMLTGLFFALTEERSGKMRRD